MQFDQLRRREFIALVGSSAIAWRSPARAQQPTPSTIGFLSAIPPNDSFLAAFRRGLAELGYVEGRNITIEYRFAERSYDQLPELASDLVRSHVAVIVAAGGAPSATAAKAITTTIPIVFTGIDDPVSSGFVASLNRPGGNMTGMSTFVAALGGKRLELLREMVPRARVIALLINPAYQPAAAEAADIEQAARAGGRDLLTFRASSESDIETTFGALAQRRPDALIVGADPFFNSRRWQLVAVASRGSIPAIYGWREFVMAGGLMSYGTNFADNYRQAGIYVGRVLKGEKPIDLPVMQPTKFELVVNLKTAKALNLSVPLTLQVAADEVIE
jgi:putative tryptophan/tyrosine transport system substrate-binding protein